MDFLDPKAKKRHKIRLFIGYALMATVIFTTSAILVFSAYGFDVDRKTGEVIQNGMVFVDSAPDGAGVVFNDKLQNYKTNNRFSMPSGDYSLKIQKEGYRDWHRSFYLEGAEVLRFTYPMLIPHNLNSKDVATYNSSPTFVSNSPDRRWVLMNEGNSLTNFIEYDLNNLDDQSDKPQERKFNLPTDLFTKADGEQSIELVEWSTDNKHVLIKHTYVGGHEFVVISKDKPTESININRLLGQNPTTVVLRDKKFDQWYVYTQQGGILQAINAKKNIENVATNVATFKSHDSDTVLYASQPNSDGKTQAVTLKRGSDSFKLKDVEAGKIFLEIAKYDGKWRVVIGADAEQKTYVFTDPIDQLQEGNKKSLTPTTVLRAKGPISWVAFSQNTRFIVAQSGQHFEVYDAEYKERLTYDIDSKIDNGSKVSWIDGHRMTARSGGKAIVFDFEGSNRQELVGVAPGLPIMFDRDYTVLYTINTKESDKTKTGFYSTEFRLEGDK